MSDSNEHDSIIGKSVVSAEKMVAFVREKNSNAQDIEEIAKCFVEIGDKYNIRGDIAFCQSIVETGWFRFDNGTAVTPDQHNYCGMGVLQKGMKGNSFISVAEGVEAQIQHLYGYAVKEPLDSSIIVDPRYKYLVSGNKLGIAKDWHGLSMNWAMNESYGKQILSIYDKLLNFEYNKPTK